MVHLSRIYTRSGDDGSTGLGDGSRRPKHDLRVATYGTVDELSSVIGVGVIQDLDQPIRDLLRGIQNDLFDVGADICVPGESGDRLRITPVYTKRLEDLIDEYNA
ncbi:MAG: cob(I)alamin adenosyltransferase, partial [Planctomycetota bacterium]